LRTRTIVSKSGGLAVTTLAVGFSLSVDLTLSLVEYSLMPNVMNIKLRNRRFLFDNICWRCTTRVLHPGRRLLDQ